MPDKTLPAKLTAEFVGTFVLVFTVGCNVLSSNATWAPVSIACSLTVMIYALGKTSGANFNPAVSFALGLNDLMAWPEVAQYCAVQLAAGVAAGFSYTALFGASFALSPQALLWQAGIAELLYTFMLVFVVLNVVEVSSRQKLQFGGLAIGFVIVAGGYAAGKISGGCFNPAVAFGIFVSSTKAADVSNFVVYTLCELLGAALATGLFCVCRPPKPDQLHETRRVRRSSMEDRDHPIKAKLVSEFIGTFMLVSTVSLNVLGSSPAGAFSIACSLMCMIFALGSSSGAHFNPAVTTAIALSGRGKCNKREALLYMAAQIFAGVCAALLCASLNVNSWESIHFALKPTTSSWAQVCIAELVYTFVLAFVVLSVATVKDVVNQYFGLIIGMCVTVGGCAIGKISGGSLNPAVSIGVASTDALNGGLFWPCLVYCLVEIGAGAGAAGIFMATHSDEFGVDK